MTSESMTTESYDVIIVGAGLSGIGAACHLSRKCSDKRFLILETREAMGGTWDLFRYPGIRSDSEMYTLGYNFKPWNHEQAIADGRLILEYIREAAAEHCINQYIRYQHRVVSANWNSSDAQWVLAVENLSSGKRCSIRCKFLLSCTGYYNYDHGYEPAFPGSETFSGQIVHPQKWPDNFNYENRQVVVIGSGATAVTLVPAMADKAQHVTMLQRSPGYVISLPQKDGMANWLRRFVPSLLVYRLTRFKSVVLNMMSFRLFRKFPRLARKLLTAGVHSQLGRDFDMRHFSPRYNPWDERLCAVPDGDLFRVIRSGDASVVTDEIECFVASGIKLKSGNVLAADIIVTATGLDVKVNGGMQISVDGTPYQISKKMSYRGVMFEDLPNMAMVFGYTNSSWTLKVDLIAEYVCRLLNYMDKHDYQQCTPINTDPGIITQAFVDMQSAYIQRAAPLLPLQGSKPPWRVYQNYTKDLASLRFSPINDGVLHFSRTAVTGLEQPA